MFNRKDPLVDSVKQVMDENRVRRDVEKLVNEAFGVTSRKGLPHELHAAYDATLTEATEIALTEGMSKLNLNEVSKEKLGRYIKNAHYEGGMADFKHGISTGKHPVTKRKVKEYYAGKSLRRMKGINTATDKLTGKAKVVAKEETEAPKTTRMNESFEQFLRNKFSKE
jgi:hypothetical protein